MILKKSTVCAVVVLLNIAYMFIYICVCVCVNMFVASQCMCVKDVYVGVKC